MVLVLGEHLKILLRKIYDQIKTSLGLILDRKFFIRNFVNARPAATQSKSPLGVNVTKTFFSSSADDATAK